MRGWHLYLEAQGWSGARKLFIGAMTDREDSRGSQRLVMLPLVGAKVEELASYDIPTLAESRHDREDGIGDVTGFLQAALDCAWENGMRPTGFKDFSNELSAVRYHLEDMRALAKVPRQT